TAYTGYASKTGLSVPGAGTLNADLVMTVPPPSTVAGLINVPASLGLYAKTLGIEFGAGASIVLGVKENSAARFELPFPVPADGTATGMAQASVDSNESRTWQSGISPGTTNVVLDLRVPDSLIAPPDQSTGVGLTTDFSWTSMADTTYVLALQGSAGKPSYYVVTGATSGRIPDFSSQGLGLPPAASYLWLVNAVGPSTGVDDLAGPMALDLPGNVHISGISTLRHFTTQYGTGATH